MKKHVILAIVLIIIGFQLSAQKTKDVLYLKNGSIIYGKLIEIVGDQYKMQTSDCSLFIYSSAEVEKFAKESPFFEGRRKEGFGIALETGLLVGSQQSTYEAPFSFNFLIGVTTNTLNTTSMGSGVEFIGRPYTPLYIEFKHLFFNRKTSPFIFARAGAVVPFGGNEETSTVVYGYNDSPKNYKGGASLTFGSGISWAKEEYDTFLSFGYRYAHTSYTQSEYNRGSVTYASNLHRLEIKFGFHF
jgi:hypothetical protein